jgi:AraC-like DNA-binding protein
MEEFIEVAEEVGYSSEASFNRALKDNFASTRVQWEELYNHLK